MFLFILRVTKTYLWAEDWGKWTHKLTEEKYLLNKWTEDRDGIRQGEPGYRTLGFSLGNQQAHFQMETNVL